MTFSIGIPLEKAQKTSFPSDSDGKSSDGTTLDGNTKYFHQQRWKCSFWAFSMRLPMETLAMEILFTAGVGWIISIASFRGTHQSISIASVGGTHQIFSIAIVRGTYQYFHGSISIATLVFPWAIYRCK